MRRTLVCITAVGLLGILVCGQQAVAGKQENSIRFVAEHKGPLTLDPHTVLQETNVNFYDNIYEGLIRHDPKTGEILPALATSWKYISDTVIEFTLRKGVVFHNNEKFDAHSVKYSYDRFFDPATESQSAGHTPYHCEIMLTNPHF